MQSIILSPPDVKNLLRNVVWTLQKIGHLKPNISELLRPMGRSWQSSPRDFNPPRGLPLHWAMSPGLTTGSIPHALLPPSLPGLPPLSPPGPLTSSPLPLRHAFCHVKKVKLRLEKAYDDRETSTTQLIRVSHCSRL